MKKLYYLIVLTLILGLVLTGCLLSNVGQVPTTGQSGISRSGSTVNYGDITLTGGFQAEHFSEVWDLTACDMIISFTYNANGLVDDFGGDAHAWAELGVRQICYGDFNPTWQVEGAGVWLATDYDWTANTFDPDPSGSPTQDLDDKLILQKAGGHGEGDYNLPSTPPNPWANHAVWFDRDGVDQWQAQMWGAIDGVTYNTGGTYDVVITLHADNDTSGTAYMTVNGRSQGFYVPNWHSGAADLMPTGMTFTGDMTKMQVFYGLYGYGATHNISFNDITVTGCLTPIVIDPITIVPELIALGTTTDLEADFTGPAGSDYTANIDWGDGIGVTVGTVIMTNGTGTVTDSYKYVDTGVFTVMLTIEESNCAAFSGTAEFKYEVVYDPSAGFVTGGGWIDSPPGAYTSDPTLTGPANFGFVSKYKKGQSTPTGNTEFQFKAGDLNFHSDSYDWLVIAGHKAMYKGTGTVNGVGNYGFMLSAIDGDPDMFRIKIWDKGSDTVIYDNKQDGEDGTFVAGGQIVIHKGK